MQEIGQEKLAVLFSPQERIKLLALGRTASNVQVQPAGSAVNNSNTGQAVMNLLSRTSGIPCLNVVTKPLQFVITDSRVNAALSPTVTGPNAATSETMRRFLQSGGLLGATGGGLAGGLLGTN